MTRSCRDLLIEVIAANSVVHTKAWMDEAAEAVENERPTDWPAFARSILDGTLVLCRDLVEPLNADTATNTARNEPDSNGQWTTAKQPAGAADTPSPQNNPGTSATTTTTGPATRDQNTNTATAQQEQPKATPNPQPPHHAPTPPPGGSTEYYRTALNRIVATLSPQCECDEHDCGLRTEVTDALTIANRALGKV